MKYFIASLLMFFLQLSYGQDIFDTSSVTPYTGENFFTTAATVDAYYRENPGVKGEKIWRRNAWFLEPRLYPSGKIENLALKTAKAYYKYIDQNENSRSTHASWSFIGPDDITYAGSPGFRGVGRVNTFAIHPTNANIIYIGTPNGGIWKTTDGGTTWTNISPDIPLLSINDVVLDPNNANIIYALTGDGDPASVVHGHITGAIRSLGIIKSTDGGNSWYPTGFSYDYPGLIEPNKLLINPNSADTQFVAHNTGLIRTTDNWATYTSVITGITIYDVEYKPTDTKTVYCSSGSTIRRSLMRGDSATWSHIFDPDFTLVSSGIRVELAVTPDFPSAIYAIVGGPMANPTIGILKSLTNGSTNSWTIQDSTTELLDAQPFYNITLAVKDNDHNDVFAGGVLARRSSTSGLTWTQIVNGHNVHGDFHDLQYRNGILYAATDGGLYKSADDGTTWTELWEGLGITEIYRISGTPQDPDLNYFGSQDNGISSGHGTSTFTLHYGGDGIVTRINYRDPDTVHWCLIYGDCNRTLDGFNTWEKMRVPSGPHQWAAPMIMDPVDPRVLFVARDSIYRSDQAGDSTSWIYLGDPLGTSTHCLAQGTNNRNRVYASSGSKIYRTDNALANPGPAIWASSTSGLPDLFITGIAVDPGDANEVYVCLSGYDAGMKVYKSTNGGAGASWTNISGSLPNVPVNCIVFRDNGFNGLFIGTDIGVFYRDDNLGQWIYFSNGLPNVIVNDLYLNTASSKLIAGTYGRGMWETDLYTGCSATLTLLNIVGIGGERHYSVSNWITSTQTYEPDLGTSIHYSAGNLISLLPGFEISGQGFFEGRISPCPPPYSEPRMQAEPATRPFIFSDGWPVSFMRED